MTDRQTKAVKDAIAEVFIPDGVYNIEEGLKLERAAKAAIRASDAHYVPMLATVLRVLSQRPIASWYGNEAGGYYAGWDDAEYAVREALAKLPAEYRNSGRKVDFPAPVSQQVTTDSP